MESTMHAFEKLQSWKWHEQPGKTCCTWQLTQDDNDEGLYVVTLTFRRTDDMNTLHEASGCGYSVEEATAMAFLELESPGSTEE